MLRENTIRDSVNVSRTSEPEYADPVVTNNYCDVRVIANPSYHSNVKTKMDLDPAYHQKRN